METAHRLTKAHLGMSERQIKARAEHMQINAKAKARSHRSCRSRWTRSDEAILRPYVEQLRFERRGEIAALSRKLSRQERAILTIRAKTASDGSTAEADTKASI